MGWRHRQGEGRKLGRQARDAVMACFCGADSFTAVPGWVFPESCLNPTLVMTSRPSADELRPADKDDSGIESPGMLYSSSSRSETHPHLNSIQTNSTTISAGSAPAPAPGTSLVSRQRAELKSGHSGPVPALPLDCHVLAPEPWVRHQLMRWGSQ